VTRPNNAWTRFAADRATLAATAILVVLAAAALLAPALAQDPEALDLGAMLASPSAEHWLGTDELGRDVLSRVLHGGRVSLAVAAATAILAALIGTLLGLAAGFAGGRADALLMRLTDGVMALPLLPLLIVLAAIDPAKLGFDAETLSSETFAVARIVAIVALVGWTQVARLVRAQTLAVKARDHVRAAVALGAGPVRVVTRHILPHVTSPVLVAASLSVGHVILVESALSFLGLGIRPPLASWGNMLTGAAATIGQMPLLALWPGLAILVTVMACNLLGDGLQRVLDPKA
jgi:peptide/nickel transport system permease protein